MILPFFPSRVSAESSAELPVIYNRKIPYPYLGSLCARSRGNSGD